MRKLFGTDGIRGVANRDLTPELFFRIGRITAWMLGREHEKPVFVVGRDTRLSGSMMEGSLIAGITSAGGEVKLLGIASTPAIAYLAGKLNTAAGMVISASHNPIEDNGLKIFDSRGFKLPDKMETEIENHYFQSLDELPRPEGQEVGQAYPDGAALEQYLDHLKETSTRLDGMKLVIDCAHGAACNIAGRLLSELGAEVKTLHDEPDGTLINVNCGATDTTDLQHEVVKNGAAAGLAFDGDADRLIAVDEKGNEVDGDAIMSICAVDMAKRGLLKKDTLVATVMSNGGLDILAEKHSLKVERTAVGDRYVLEKIISGGYSLGGEQSGHIIFSDHATTGDGLLTALKLLTFMQENDKPLSDLAARLECLPQVLVNQKVVTKEGWAEKPRISRAIRKIEDELGKHGRILVRPSGTEAKIRVMIEAPLDKETLLEYAESLAEIIKEEQS
ncbi:MAG: phosphoglucosamine mutase [Bacillota bacterium]